MADEAETVAAGPTRKKGGGRKATTLASITKQLRQIADSGQAHEAAAGLHAARAALMDIARLNGLEPEPPAGGARSLEKLLAAIPDDDEPDAGAAGQADADQA